MTSDQQPDREPATARSRQHARGPLVGLRVIDMATVVAGPSAARYLADFGATVIKVERPDGGDTARALGFRHPDDGESLWWKQLGRNKFSVALDLKDSTDLATMKTIAACADVLIENFRPGTLERLGLDPPALIAANPRLVVCRVTGFGQTGPYAGRPGFASLAEAMSGFAAMNGEPDGAPLLPPIALTDEVTGLVAAFAVMAAVHGARGQVIDVNLLESMMQLLGPALAALELLGYEQPRLGSGIPYTVPRGTYRAADDRWVAISTSAEPVAQRLLALIGVGGDPRFTTSQQRIDNRTELDRLLGQWVATRPAEQVVAELGSVDAAAAVVLSVAELAQDQHVTARGSFSRLDGTPMPGLVAHYSATPGALRWAGRSLGADTAIVTQAIARGLDPFVAVERREEVFTEPT